MSDANESSPEVTDLGSMTSVASGVDRQVVSLMDLLSLRIDIEAQFCRKLHELEWSYENKIQEIRKKRSLIIRGVVKAVDLQSCKISDEKFNDDDVSEVCEQGEIKNFWLTAMRNSKKLSRMIFSHDEPILSYLMDITVHLTKDPMGFVLCFFFSQNPYFTNPVLKKEYFLKCAVNPDYPYEFQGPEVVGCKGCNIRWKKGKNVTVETVKRRGKKKRKGGYKHEKRSSFFKFFELNTLTKDVVLSRDAKFALADFAVGQYFRNSFIPRAIQYYCAEVEDDSDDEVLSVFDDSEDSDDSVTY
ncbi:Nucleosome assembly protein 1-like 4 [Trichinella patagoniensis]|uniref:Nucleosome assembly protein 1-like 4 n=2 Tax=Trichinella TaxID=6333 RepID=A0A0V0ZV98_9BILA|nr:Nucleosome assembly protein 1-like 4 [Trichinella murrelli]KRX58684.1 Nucleosome assembly protein 1-like 4 [Trichinella sp. T9]KRY16381.1 Nucleosome assembly protein 1-like 4 [Trichinella patagoniensis]